MRAGPFRRVGAANASSGAPPSPSPSAAPHPSPKTPATAFVEIPFKVITADAEGLGARLLTTELVLPAAATPGAAAKASLDATLERMVSILESSLRWCSRVAAGEDVPDPAAAAGLADASGRLKGMHRRSRTKFIRQRACYFSALVYRKMSM